MKADRELWSVLEDICFKYERLWALTSCLQSLVAEGVIDISGIPKDVLQLSLYEIEDSTRENNEVLKKLLEDGKVI